VWRRTGVGVRGRAWWKAKASCVWRGAEPLCCGLAGLAAAAACSGKGSTGSRTLVAFLEGRWEFKDGSGRGWVDVFDDGTYLVFGGDGSE
jgi:hypothetical protein